MTKEEQTIANLKKLKSVHNGSYGPDIDRAIKALEAEPCEDAVCGALERLTPKKVGGDTVRLVDLHNGAWKKVGGYKCPECNADVGYRNRFCHACGQAIDWRVK